MLDTSTTGSLSNEHLFEEETQILTPDLQYRRIRDIIINSADWKAVARQLSADAPNMASMMHRAIIKVLQKDPRVGRSLYELINYINSAANEDIIYG
ncbi:hypothetical protein C4588_03585 [Candidatus Parcubacteria bacterium]|nr:MAG: hypothetical protein C4588_03585 [Candidatus Parcubacteria bacterium]